MSPTNIFRMLGDASHFLSKCILIWAIHVNQSAEGVSLITQALYALVFCSRYLDLFSGAPSWWLETYNMIMKIFYILSSFYIIFIMLRVFPRTREREKAWKFGAACLAGSAVIAPFAMLIFDRIWGFWEVLWDFSLVLESVAVLPQLLLLRQTSVPTVIDSFYLLTLGSYRALYIGNWIERGITEPNEPAPLPVIFGVIQTLFYLDFAWVYWTRQRVKLRNGAVVDGDDYGRGYLVTKVLRTWRSSLDLEDGDRPAGAGAAGPRAWGARGISVSADDQVRPQGGGGRKAGADEEEGMLSAPDEFEDHDSDVDDALPVVLPRDDGRVDAGHGED